MALPKNAPVTTADGYSLASREGLWQPNSAESTLAQAVRTPSCGAQDSRNGQAADKRERRDRVTSSYRRFTSSGSMAPAAQLKLYETCLSQLEPAGLT
jgi:hypothetical protein